MFEISLREPYILVKALGENILSDFIDAIGKEMARPDYPSRNDLWLFDEALLRPERSGNLAGCMRAIGTDLTQIDPIS